MNDQLREKITAALTQLDHTNDDHWTEDGSPRTSVVQKIAADQTIKRTDINEAAPGFARKVGDAMGDPAEGLGNAPPAASQAATSDETGLIDTSGQGHGEPLSEDEVRQILIVKVKDAEQAINAALTKQKQGHQEEIAARRALEAAKVDLGRRFPPKTQAENIKDFLRSEHQKRIDMANARMGVMPAQIDMAMQRGNSRGWTRPHDTSHTGGRRAVTLASGQTVMGGNRRVG